MTDTEQKRPNPLWVGPLLRWATVCWRLQSGIEQGGWADLPTVTEAFK